MGGVREIYGKLKSDMRNLGERPADPEGEAKKGRHREFIRCFESMEQHWGGKEGRWG